jgi:abortive infection bacteriophage resistance protein
MAQNKIPYNKSHLSISDQIAKLQSRGMQFTDVSNAEHCLAHMNYYRLTAYWLPYEQDHATHTFRAGTSFDEILKYYVFDRELRVLVLNAIERVEVSVRTQMAYILSNVYGSHPHMKPEIFKCPVRYAQNLNKLKGEFDRSSETFSDHFKNKYQEKLPPIWAAVELMTLGQISHWYSNIKQRSDRNTIARVYDLDEKILTSYLHNLTIVRNICAHHGRLWNKRFTFSVKIPQRPTCFATSINSSNRKSLYNLLVFLKYMIEIANPDDVWGDSVKEIIDTNNINISAMGFPENWKTLPVWQ